MSEERDGGPARAVDDAPGWFARHRTAVNGALVLAVLVIMALAITRLTEEVRYADIVEAWGRTSWSRVALAVGFTALSFLALTFYDVGALGWIGRRLPYAAVAVTAFPAYAVGNTAGFGPLSGGAIRYRAYSRFGLTPDEIAAVIGFVTLAFGLGLAFVAAVSILFVAGEMAGLTGLTPGSLRALAVLALALILALPFAGRLSARVPLLARFAGRMPGPGTVLRQLAVTAVDVAASAAVLYVFLPGGIGFPAFLAVYAVAIGIGVLSHVPAGLGVFETVIVATLGHAADVDAVLGALVLYRIVYHVVPLLAASLLVSVTEVRRAAATPLGAGIRRVGARLSPLILSTLALTLGAMLVFSSVTPTPGETLAALAGVVPLAVVEGAHFLASLLGLALLVVSRGLAQRLDGAWLAAVVAAALALVLSLLKAVALAEALVLVFFLVALLIGRRQFDRPASLMAQALTGSWLLAIATILLGAAAILVFVYRDVDYSHELWWQFEFSSEAPRSLRALLGLVIAASLVAIWSLLRPALPPLLPPDGEALARAGAIVDAQGVADANLVRMGDKSLLFSEDGRAFVMYARQNRSLVALFDPVGPRECWPDLVWRFIEMARGQGCRAAFYQVSPEALSLYADAGFQAYKLGETALIDLARFDLKGGKRAGLRQTAARAERDGLRFALVETADVPAVLPELQAVSDAWLAHHQAREKGFSLGAFEPAYMRAQPVAVLRVEGRIVAFANVLVTAARQEASIDLMRFDPAAPRGAMDFLFLRVMDHAKAKGFKRFNLGMAPLSGMSGRPVAPVWNRVGRMVFDHGERYYNFKGLRAFKAKFHPDWQPRYMAVSGGLNPLIALMDATVLIGGGMRGVMSK